MEEDQNYILEELAWMFHRTLIGELPHLKSYRPAGGALIYVCADLQSGQWLVKAIDNHRIGSRARLRVTNAKNLPKPVRIALRTRNKLPKARKSY
jgi:hypothetical protein